MSVAAAGCILTPGGTSLQTGETSPRTLPKKQRSEDRQGREQCGSSRPASGVSACSGAAHPVRPRDLVQGYELRAMRAPPAAPWRASGRRCRNPRGTSRRWARAARRPRHFGPGRGAGGPGPVAAFSSSKRACWERGDLECALEPPRGFCCVGLGLAEMDLPECAMEFSGHVVLLLGLGEGEGVGPPTPWPRRGARHVAALRHAPTSRPWSTL